MPNELDLQISVEVKDHHASSALCGITVESDNITELQTGTPSLSANIYGQVCKGSQTLPSLASIVDTSAHGALTGSATVIDPTPWTPELPATYLATVHLSIDDGSPSTYNHPFGFKSLETREDSFYINQRRFVPRLAQLNVQDHDVRDLLDVIREEYLCLAIRHPKTELLELATEQGCWVFVLLDGSEDPATVLSWCKHPACFAVVLTTEASIQLIDPLRNQIMALTMLGQQVTAGQTLSDFVHFVMVEASELGAIDFAKKPIVVTRNDSSVSIENGRRGCELIQRDTAATADFAGYAVLNSKTPGDDLTDRN